jgi:hypothetical protein
MKSGIDELLDHVDQWKFKVHEKLKRMTPLQRKAFWKRIHEDARVQGLRAVEAEAKPKRPRKGARKTG